MIRPIRLLLVSCFLGSLTLPLLAVFASIRSTGAKLPAGAPLKIGTYVVLAPIAFVAFAFLFRKLQPYLEGESLAQAQFLETIPSSYISVAILSAAGLSLFLELSVIRWQGSVLTFFAFYKNYGLLSCFAGLGLGYAMSRSDKGIPLILTLPLLGWQFVLLYLLRYLLPVHSLEMIPFREQLTMGIEPAKPFQIAAAYVLLSVVFLLTALAFFPVGQLCGKLMERKAQLPAYGLNLLGSLLGVLLMFLVSFLWTPPVIWFGVCSVVLLFFVPRRPKSLLVGTAVTMLLVCVLSWPFSPYAARVYSPYQLLEFGYSQNGLMSITAAGTFYQYVYDFSPTAGRVAEDPRLRNVRSYYEVPYKIIRKPNEVAIVGAGSGNDVAAALRGGAGHVDAIEIDPAILRAGKIGHPERPYDDPRVQPIVNDARSFFRNTTKKYDVIVYGLLDSHTLLSHASSVRLDSFVYTVEGLREARSRLKDDGVLSLSFAVLNDALGEKIFRMMTEAFGKEPLCFFTEGGTIFIQSLKGNLSISPNLIADNGLVDRSDYYRNSAIPVSLSTDDWPFLYMPRRVYPVSYLLMIALILFLSVVLFSSILRERLQVAELPFFFLGAGFMLVETKAITEMGLTFGNTWQVIAFAIASVLVMAFLANAVVAWLRLETPYAAYILLIISLIIGWWIAGHGGLPSTTAGRLGTAVILTCPLFFSGIVFSVLLSAVPRISSAMSMNLLGAMCGGILEYNSMYFGFRFLYILAIILYASAFLSGLSFRGSVLVPAIDRQG
jgi:hypothetical protein